MYSINRHYLLCELLIMLVLLAPIGAMAQPQESLELSIAGSALHFGYKEFDDSGKVLDREDGFIPGFIFGLSQTTDRWVFASDFAFHGGDVIYTGQTNTGTPITSRTIQSIGDLSMRTEFWPTDNSSFNYGLYLGAGYH